jgi:hypothetical protein
VRIDNVFDHRLRFAAHLLPVGHAEAELGEHLLMRNRLVVLAPFVGFGDRLRFGRDQQSTGLLPFLLTAIGRRDQGGVHRRQNDAGRIAAFALLYCPARPRTAATTEHTTTKVMVP